MKYWTVDWCKECDIYGFLANPVEQAEWDESVAFWKERGIDFVAMRRDDFESLREELLRFLPKRFHRYMSADTFAAVCPRDLLKYTRDWQENYPAEVERRTSQYNKEFNSIKHALPSTLVDVLEDSSLSNNRIESFAKPSESSFLITLSDWAKSRTMLTFTG